MHTISESLSSQLKFELGMAIKKVCHQYGTVHVIKDTGSRRKCKPKLIVVVNDEEAAEKLKKNVQDMVESANNYLKEVLKEEKTKIISQEPIEEDEEEQDKFVPIKYKTKIINGFDLTLSITDAHSAKGLSKEKFLQFLKQWLQEESAAERIECLEQDIIEVSAYDDNTRFVVHTDTGNSYRLTYFDPVSERRKQVSVGNVCIVYTGGENVELVVDRRQKKQRIDKKEFKDSITKSVASFIIAK